MGENKSKAKIENDWEDAMGQAIQKPKPAEGWPKPEPMPQRAPLNPQKGPRKKKGGK